MWTSLQDAPVLSGKAVSSGKEQSGAGANLAKAILRVGPSFLDLVFLAPIGFLAARSEGLKTMLGDGDTGWHLRTGEWILANGRVPATDLFSFTKPGEAWFAWEWLWDASFAWLQKFGGMGAVLLVSALILCVTFGILYGVTRKKSNNSPVALVVTLIAVCASSIHWLARPHLVTLLFVVLFYQLLDIGADHRKKLLIGLPVLMIAWTNLHGGFIAGLIMIGAYFAGAVATAIFSGGAERTRARGQAILFAQVLGLCLLATLCNPYYFKLHTHLFEYLTDGYQMKNIAEFQSVSFHHPVTLFFEVMMILGLAAAFWNLRRGKYTPFILILVWVHLALISGRNIPIFVILAAPSVAEMLAAALAGMCGRNESKWTQSVARNLMEFCGEMNVMESIPRLHLASAAGIWLVGSLLYSAAPPVRFAPHYDSKIFPAGAANKIRESNLTTRIFSTDDWSGYLIYELPGVKVFVDGRSDFYGPKFGEEYSGVLNVRHGWEDTLRKYGVQTILLPPESYLSAALKESHGWRCIYDDGTAILFESAIGGPRVSAALHGAGEPAI